MSSTTDIEMAYSPDGSDALTSSDLLKTTNGDLLKMLLEMKKQNTDLITQVKKNTEYLSSQIHENGTQNKKALCGVHINGLVNIAILFMNVGIFILVGIILDNANQIKPPTSCSNFTV